MRLCTFDSTEQMGMYGAETRAGPDALLWAASVQLPHVTSHCVRPDIRSPFLLSDVGCCRPRLSGISLPITHPHRLRVLL